MAAFCCKHEVYCLSDIAYSEIYCDGNLPSSILEVPGVKDIAIEFSSLSEAYSMPGWRIGFAPRNPRLTSALARIKSYLATTAPSPPVQVAVSAALNGAQECIEQIRTLLPRAPCNIKSFLAWSDELAAGAAATTWGNEREGTEETERRAAQGGGRGPRNGRRGGA